jgi:DNA-directed RNA polymerase specialized sigma24 family protein
MSKHTQTPEPETAAETIAAAYRMHFEVLEYLAVQKFHVPEDDVRGVIHDVFLAFIRNRARIREERSWLVGAMCIQCRLYWRSRGRGEVLCGLEEGAEPAAIAEDIGARVDASAVLRRLPRRCRELLHLRFFEEFSSEEIARRYATTVHYARKLVYQCVLNARSLLDRRNRDRS